MPKLENIERSCHLFFEGITPIEGIALGTLTLSTLTLVIVVVGKIDLPRGIAVLLGATTAVPACVLLYIRGVAPYRARTAALRLSAPPASAAPPPSSSEPAPAPAAAAPAPAPAPASTAQTEDQARPEPSAPPPDPIDTEQSLPEVQGGSHYLADYGSLYGRPPPPTAVGRLRQPRPLNVNVGAIVRSVQDAMETPLGRGVRDAGSQLLGALARQLNPSTN